MRGLLSTRDIRTANTPLGLLGVALPPVNRAPMPAVAPAASATPRRERVSPWRIFDRVLGGQTVTEGLDAERARLDAEAMRPQQMEQMARLRGLAEQMGPAALLAFETNPEKFGENLAEQYAPQVIAAGGVQSVIGNGQRVAAPSFAEFGQDMVRRDPITGAVETVASRGPTFSEQTARINANNPVNVAPGGVLVDPRTGSEVARGADRVFSAAEGAQLYNEQGQRIAENVRDAPPVNPEDARKAAERANSAITRIGHTREAVRRAREQAGAFTTGVGSVLAAIPGTPAADLRATIDTIQANLSFTELQKMREASPTGGALGGIAVRELDLLGATVASLSQTQSPEEFARSLATIDRSLNEWERAVRTAQQQGQQTAAPSREALLAEARRRGLIR